MRRATYIMAPRAPARATTVTAAAQRSPSELRRAMQEGIIKIAHDARSIRASWREQCTCPHAGASTPVHAAQQTRATCVDTAHRSRTHTSLSPTNSGSPKHARTHAHRKRRYRSRCCRRQALPQASAGAWRGRRSQLPSRHDDRDSPRPPAEAANVALD
jgi:hypothetical protein